ncbi:MAG TPA: transcription-repair coupling factor [Verrucomicrobiota bacterium]|nr:transcription-repair coupling factor [Verrucomicrobiota bacterium]
MAQDSAIAAASELFAQVLETPAARSLARRLEQGGVLSLDGITAAAQPFLAALVRQLFPRRPIVVVTDGLRSQESAQQDLATWLAAGAEGRRQKSEVRRQNHASPVSQPSTLNPQPLFYPAWEVLPHEARLPHADVISERLETLVALTPHASRGTRPPPLIVASVSALLQRTFSVEPLRAGTRTLARGDRVDPLDLVEWLEAQGYEPEAQVTQKGELALRGGILDVYPLTSPWPVRLEFFGDELESLRQFDPLTQISREEIQAVAIPPAGELGLLKRMRGAESGTRDAAPQPPLGTLLDYLPPETVVVLCEPGLLAERAEEYAAQVPDGDPFFIAWEALQDQARKRGMTLVEVSETEPGLPARANEAADETSPDVPSPSSFPAPRSAVANAIPDSAPSAPRFASLDGFRPLPERAPEQAVAEAQRREFFAQLHRWLRQGWAVHVFCNNDGERQRFRELWDEYGLAPNGANAAAGAPASCRLTPPEPLAAPGLESSSSPSGSDRCLDLPDLSRQDAGAPSSAAPANPAAAAPAGLWAPSFRLRTHLGTLARGFLCDEAKLAVVTDAEIFGRYKVQRPRRLKSPHALATRSALDIDFTELEEGDYVVHVQHGIGRYLGLQVVPLGAGTKPTDGPAATAHAGQECLVIEFAPRDSDQQPPRLFVPVTEAHLVGKYVGTGKARPPLNKLGGTRWARTKAQAERAVRDVASDLLAIQAARESQPGHPFAPDAPWQREFESAFIFEETPDQARAIVETKTDMERPKPMDRLICGDVGFGKTEVGIRAAFKAVMDGKQVAVLVPTTVLAQQHFNTFRERMADYPVRLELLSRFRTRRAQEQVVRDLAAGAVDIVIGTHRLLQKDIAFKDLGLVVIDEEQRFGVMHKEKFKMLRRLVDVLTLSATPIPRTLYLALTGARDMSTIQTPPHDRLPVETIVTGYDERVIRDAIQRELNRGGQVFFLHNRVMTIATMAGKLQALLPHARIVVGHGQMHSDDLEEVMTRFVNGEADVLLSTTIIESGLDIPNANTIIIDRADRFGLSDLYQLRGRVGRYKHQAYAYLLLPRHGSLLTDVRKRLSAIKQYSTLGSGFKIAMRDLEIRGAGNLLGAEQSGHITAVGFELYCQLLKQSVAGLKGEKVKPRLEVPVRLDFLALGPAGESPTSSLAEAEVRQGDAPAPSPTHPAPRPTPLLPCSAYIPFRYISDARQRIEIYRKLAQVTDKAGLSSLEQELRDRFGPVPPQLALLLQIAELKVLAGGQGITVIEVKDGKLMLTRNDDYIMIGSKFPRLERKQPGARLKEIKKFLLAIAPGTPGAPLQGA